MVAKGVLVCYMTSLRKWSITLDSHLTTYIPQAVNNGQRLFIASGFSWSNMQFFLHCFTPERFRIFYVLNLIKKKWSNKDFGVERTWSEDHSLKNLRSIHLAYLRVDDCRWKKNHGNHLGDRHWLPAPALHLQAFASHRDEAFVSRFK